MAKQEGFKSALGVNETFYSQKLTNLIRIRKTEVAENLPYLRNKKIDLPNLKDLPDTFNTIFTTSALWTVVDGQAYTPDIIPKCVLQRKDGKDIDLKLFSVFISDMKRTILNKYQIYPLAAPNKSRHQFWDETFVRAFLLNIEYDNRHRWNNINKIAYKITPGISVDYLLEVHNLFLKDLYKKKDK